MRIAIIEPFSAGHRASYVRWLTLAFLNADMNVTIVGGAELLKHPEVANLQMRATPSQPSRCVQIEVTVPPAATKRRGRFAMLRSEFRMRNWFESAYLSAVPVPRNDVVFVPYLDYCFHAIAMLGSPFRNT